MICPHCGRYLEDGVAFCIYCGQRLGKYASEDAADSFQTASLDEAPPTMGETPAPAAAAPLSAEATPVAGAAAATAATAATAAAAAPVAPASAQEAVRSTRPSVSGRTRDSRLHADDEIARRMGELDDEPGTGKGRKVLGGIILAALAAGAIALGVNYIAPSIMDNGGSSSAVTSPSTASTASSSSSKASSSSSAKSSKSTTGAKGSSKSAANGAAAGEDTKRGSTLERANGTGAASDNAAANTDTVAAVPTTGDETTTGIVNTYTAAPTTKGFSDASATATSISPTEGGVTHGPELVLDGKPETAWNTNENGVGQSITIKVDKLSEVNGLKIMNGYNKVSASGTDLYKANARAKKILIEYATGSFEYTLKDKKGKYQDIPFKDPQPTDWMKITILSVYPGDLYDDCCISEVKVY